MFRAIVVLGVLVLLVRMTGTVAGEVAGQAGRGVPLTAAEVVTAVAAGVAALLLAWLGMGVALALVASLPGRVGHWAGGAARGLTPAVVRRAVGLVLGATVAAGVAPGASVAAAPSSSLLVLERPDPAMVPLPDPGWASPPSGVQAAALEGMGGGADDGMPPDPGWVPEPPLVRPQPDLTALSPARPAVPGSDRVEVVVRRGDTLWSIAARHLGGDPSDAEVAAAWPAWHAANRDVVGEDPDLLLPGQVLRAPEAVVS